MFSFFPVLRRGLEAPSSKSSMDPLWRAQPLQFPALLRRSFADAREVLCMYAENPESNSRFAARIACSTAMRNRAAAWSGQSVRGKTVTSKDHYAEGPGEFTCWTILRMRARTTHDQTTERTSMITEARHNEKILSKQRANGR